MQQFNEHNHTPISFEMHHLYVAVQLCLLILAPSTVTIFIDGQCPTVQEQSVLFSNDSYLTERTLLPLIITIPDGRTYSTPYNDSTYRTSYRFSAAFGPGNCVEAFQLDLNVNYQQRMGVFTNGSVIHSGNVYVEFFDNDWLVFLCQHFMESGRIGHVAHLWILRQKNFMTGRSIEMDHLVNKYNKFYKRFGIPERYLLEFSNNDFEFCDEYMQYQYFRYGSATFWYRTITVMVILIIVLAAVGWFAIKVFYVVNNVNR